VRRKRGRPNLMSRRSSPHCFSDCSRGPSPGAPRLVTRWRTMSWCPRMPSLKETVPQYPSTRDTCLKPLWTRGSRSWSNSSTAQTQAQSPGSSPRAASRTTSSLSSVGRFLRSQGARGRRPVSHNPSTRNLYSDNIHRNSHTQYTFNIVKFNIYFIICT